MPDRPRWRSRARTSSPSTSAAIPSTDATIRLVGGKVALRDREYEKGEIVELGVRVRISEVAFVDQLDSKTGDVGATERRHKAKIIGVEEL